MSYQYGYSSNPSRQPLPAGWEAKYDSTNRKWFYINHITKKTQWDDPRLNIQQQPRVNPYRQQPVIEKPQQTATTTSFIDAEPNKAKEIVENYKVDKELANSLLRTHMNNTPAVEKALRDMGFTKKPTAQNADLEKVEMLMDQYGVKEALARSVLRSHQNNLSSAGSAISDMGYRKRADPKAQFVQLLKSQYRSAPVSTIKSQLLKTNNSVQGARMGLEAMGYKREVIDGSPVAKPGPTGYKPKQQEPKTSRPKTAATSKAAHSKVNLEPKVDVEKLKRELKKKFPDVDDVTIRLCLKVAKNDATLASRLMEFEAKRIKDEKEQRPTTSMKEEERSVRNEVEEPRDFAPKVFGSDDLPASSSVPTVNIATFSHSSNIPEFFSGTSVPVSAATPVSRKKERYAAVKKVQRQERKPAPGGYSSTLRIEPMGPNPDLCKGADPNLLLKTYAERMGPNKANRKGPMKSNRCGPDSRNRFGPGNLAMGPAAHVIEV